jgi:heme-degrading monooxygenase HmoA
MPWVLIIHEVADYTAWKGVFDDAAELRRQAGEQRFQVLRAQDEANRIIHFSEWSSLDAARHFFASPQLERIREQAGVRSPTFLYLEELDGGVL